MVKRILFALLLVLPFLANSQSLDELLLIHTPVGNEAEYAAFSSTRILNGHSVEQLHAGHSDFRISTRFEEFRHGVNDFFGLDKIFLHLGFEHGFTDWLMGGIGRSNFEDTYDLFFKVRLMTQSSRHSGPPLFISFLTSSEFNASKWKYDEADNTFGAKLAFVEQLLIARKFSKNFSFQLTPTFIHKNYVPVKTDSKELFALGAGARLKVSDRVSINAEYFHGFRSGVSQDYPNSVALGVDIDTGGHVFQLMLTNVRAAREAGFIWGEFNSDLGNPGIQLGINISRVYSPKKSKLN